MKKYILLVLAAFTMHSVLSAQSKADYRQKFTEGNYLILEGNYFQALKNFLEAYQIDSSSSNINYKVGICYLNTITEKSKALYYLEKAVLKTTTKYTDLEPREENAPVNAFYYYGKALHQNYKFDEAIANYEKFKSYLKASQKDMIADVDRQIAIANNAKALVSAPINVVIKNLGDSINTAYPDYSPVLSADEETMIFTSRRPGSTGGDKTIEDQFYEDIYISYKKTDSTWTAPVSVSSNVNTFTHEASVGLTADAQTLLIYKDANGGDIYYSTLDGENWTFPMAMGSDINSPSWETSACLSPDGNTLYYVSDRKEGSLGGRDIWKCVKLPNGKWSRSMNVGAPINTPFDEESPFIHPSGNILFFSSNGHKTIGGFDIFFSTLNEGNWEAPLNIGYPINTTDDDVFYVTSPDGKRGYYASSSRAEGYGEKDIYIITIPERKEQPLVLIKGVIIPAEGTQLPSDLEIVATNNETGIVTGVYKPLMRDGSFTIIIPPNSNYTLSYQKDGQEFYSEVMEVPADAAYQEINRELKLKPVNFGQVVSVETKDSTQQTANSSVSYFTVEGRLYDEKNNPLNALKVNLMDANGNILKTTNTNELGWFLFNELPTSGDYIVALDEEDPHFISKKSFAEFKDDKGNVLKTKNVGNKYQLVDNKKTSVSFRNNKKAIAAQKGQKEQPHHEQLASVDKLNFKMNFKYNVTQIDVNDGPYTEFINNLMDLYNKNGTINVTLMSCASTVPTRAFASNKELSSARADKAKEQLLDALKAKGVDASKVNFVKVRSVVDGPAYNSDYILNRATYEKYQFIKISAY
ncbi:MAG: PD40 domain-containing protein [Bacteroidetes bacterium]|nr:PD40 domain-containing protein [Bacteroidota bacterium]